MRTVFDPGGIYRLAWKPGCSLQDPLSPHDTGKPLQIGYLQEKLRCSLQDGSVVFDGLGDVGIGGFARCIPGVWCGNPAGNLDCVPAIFAGCLGKSAGNQDPTSVYGGDIHVCVSAGNLSDCKRVAGGYIEREENGFYKRDTFCRKTPCFLYIVFYIDSEPF